MEFKVESIEEAGNFISVKVMTIVNDIEIRETFKFREEDMDGNGWRKHIELWVKKQNKTKKALKKIKGKTYQVGGN